MSKWRSNIPSTEITPEGLYLRRRAFIAGGAAAATGLVFSAAGCKDKAGAPKAPEAPPAPRLATLPGVVPGPFGTSEPQTPYADITSYNNF